VAYAAVSDVIARAGRFAGAFQISGKHPDTNDIAGFLVDLSNEVDSAIRSRGFDPAALTQPIGDALRDLVAYGALARAYAALSLPPQPAYDEAKSIWDDGLAGIVAGTFTAIAELEAGAGGVSAGSLWDDEPAYGMNVPPSVRLGLNPYLAPLFEKHQTL
jgi:hypothetical protein